MVWQKQSTTGKNNFCSARWQPRPPRSSTRKMQRTRVLLCKRWPPRKNKRRRWKERSPLSVLNLKENKRTARLTRSRRATWVGKIPLASRAILQLWIALWADRPQEQSSAVFLLAATAHPLTAANFWMQTQLIISVPNRALNLTSWKNSKCAQAWWIQSNLH